MAIEFVRPALQVHGLSPAEKLVLVTLADYSNDDGEAWPSIPTLQRFTGISRSQLFRIVKRLERLTYLRRRSGRGLTHSNRYALDLQALTENVAPMTPFQQTGAPENVSPMTPFAPPEKVSPMRLKRCHPRHPIRQ
jgi:hypothetical protein